MEFCNFKELLLQMVLASLVFVFSHHFFCAVASFLIGPVHGKLAGVQLVA